MMAVRLATLTLCRSAVVQLTSTGALLPIWSKKHFKRMSTAAAPKANLQQQITQAVQGFLKPELPSGKQQMNMNFPLEQACASQRGVDVRWADGQVSTFHYEWLHRNRPEKHLACGQNTQSPLLRPPLDVHLSQATITSDQKALRIKWGEGGEVSMFDSNWLRQYAYASSVSDDRVAQRRPVRASAISSIEYNEIQENAGLQKWLETINRDGLCLLKNVPVQEGMVLEVGKRIGGVMHTIYGTKWDVRAETNPINCAFTNQGLDLHQDLAYYESPPGIQLLHCLRFDKDIVGGLSTFADAIYAAELLRQRDAKAFECLTRIPATFQKIHYHRASPVHLEYRRPHIEVNHHDNVVNVFWAPAFEGPLEAPEHDVVEYYRAYWKFAEILEQDDVQLQFRLSPGDLIVFSNRRMVHGRTSFTEVANASRHLQGCYVSIEDYINRLRVLQNQEAIAGIHGRALSGVQIARCGNGDFS